MGGASVCGRCGVVGKSRALGDAGDGRRTASRASPAERAPGGLVEQVSGTVLVVFDALRSEFKEITRRAKIWFERQDWRAAQAGAGERLDLYARAVARMKQEATAILGPGLLDRATWQKIKASYSRLIAYRNDEELAETFFNSVTRAVFGTEGVDGSIEFVYFDNEILPSGDETPVYRAFYRTETTEALIREILQHYTFGIGYADLEGDAQRVADAVEAHLLRAWTFAEYDAIELLEPVFYRNKGAYLVGRLRRGSRIIPFILPLANSAAGVLVDAVLLTETEASIVFSYTRFYFLVDVDRPVELIGFLRTILPVKPIAELYIALGFTKHGKTVLYRHLHRHLAQSTDKFEIAPGERGMVMMVFTLRSFDAVFKVIRDAFEFPKNTSADAVKRSYHLVFRHDRVGRLVDAQEFEQLRFERDRFSPALLEELERSCAQRVRITRDEVVLRHVYTERRLNPLNLYLTEVGPEKARDAVVDWGNAIRDLAAANIFPGDLLIKNFGVTRHGRVVFYDYDELCLLSDCHFRRLPEPRDELEETALEPWFYVGPNDVFPEEFPSFLWLAGDLRQVMMEVHGDLFTVEFWQDMQARHRAGEVIDVFPYRRERRFLVEGR